MACSILKNGDNICIARSSPRQADGGGFRHILQSLTSPLLLFLWQLSAPSVWSQERFLSNIGLAAATRDLVHHSR